MKAFCVLTHLVLCLSTTDLAPEQEPEKIPFPKVRRPIIAAEVKPAVDLSGYYECDGLEVGGKKYSGLCVLKKKSEIYIVTWVIGTQTFTGVGVHEDGRFSVSWAVAADKGMVRGINAYKVHDGPKLVGRWATLPGPGIIQDETLTFLKALPDE